MCGIDERLQILWSSETARRRKETADMIAERAIVRMLLHRHYLYAVVSVLYDTRQYVVTEFGVCAHFLRILPHADMALINEQRAFYGTELLLFPHIRSLRFPHLCRENLRFLILYHTPCPRGDTLSLTSVPAYAHLVKVAMLKSFGRELQFPVACALNALCLILVCFLPAVKVAYEIQLRCIGRPLAEHPAAGCFMKPVIVVTACKVLKCLLSATRKLTYFI